MELEIWRWIGFGVGVASTVKAKEWGVFMRHTHVTNFEFIAFILFLTFTFMLYEFYYDR